MFNRLATIAAAIAVAASLGGPASALTHPDEILAQATGWKEDRMSQTQDTIVAALMEQLIAEGPENEIAFLAIEASPSFVRQPEGNGVAERFIRTLKENLLWVRHFETIEELRLALLDFAAWYNTHWLVARHGHRTPAQIRADQQPAMDQAA